MLAVLIVLFFILLLLSLLLMPITIRLDGVFSLRSSRFSVAVRPLNLFSIDFNFRLCLLREPYFTIHHLKKDGSVKIIPLLSKKKHKSKIDFESLIKKLDLKVQVILGIENDAALTVWSIGALYSALKAAAKLYSLQNHIEVAPVYDLSIFRIKVFGITRLNPANIINIYLKKRGK
ncbi:MAG: hypothetical protein Q4C01_00535 [Clostridia bacterium]|nr:hypothetical protein [Clostridia bacterium]